MPQVWYFLINPVMENHIMLTPGFPSNSYLRQFQVAQLNFYLFLQEEKLTKMKHRVRQPLQKAHEER